MKPDFVIAGLNGTAQSFDRLLQLTVVDGEGEKSDSCNIVLDDRDCGIILPQKGDVFTVMMGYEGALGFMGMFTVADVETSGPPRQVNIQAKAADMTSQLKEQRQKGYKKKTIGAIVGEIAGRHGLAPNVLGGLAGFNYDYLAQTGVSDMHFLTELATRHDAMFKIANGQLIFGEKGLGMSFSGAGMGMVMIQGDLVGGSDVLKYNAKVMARPELGEVKGAYWDRFAAEEKYEKGSGSGQSPTRVRKHHKNKAEAGANARGKGKKSQREGGGVSIDIVGRPGVAAEMLMTIVGVRPGSADGVWRIKQATHTLNANGYVTSIEGEFPSGGGGGAG